LEFVSFVLVFVIGTHFGIEFNDFLDEADFGKVFFDFFDESLFAFETSFDFIIGDLEDFVRFFDDDFSEGGDVFEVLFHFGVLLIDEKFDFFGRYFADDFNVAFGGLIGIVNFEDFSEEFLCGFVNFF
jgi:hypothetical protein